MFPEPIIMIDYIKTFLNNILVYYCFNKMLSFSARNLKKNIILIISNLLLSFIYIQTRDIFNSFLPYVIMCCLYGMILSFLQKTKLGISIVTLICSYALSFLCHTIGVIMQFVPYKMLYIIFRKENIYLSLVLISIFQFLLIYYFFKIRRFKNGFSFLKSSLNNEVSDIIIINISIIVVIIYCITGTYYDQITWNLITAFLILGIVMFFTIKKMFTMYYKQKLLTDTMDEYKKELVDKQTEIDRLKAEKINVSKITHDFYNRQKALELLVASNMNKDNIDMESASPSVLKIIESLTSEYSGRFEEIKELPKLDKTDILEIDNMFGYMQNECRKNNINFKLKVAGNIHSLINNIIDKNKLETLIGDHLRDAINAVNKLDSENKEIMAILGIKNKKYEFSVLDTGVDFEIDTLLKLGLERVTTGGTGIGFMTTFETLKETKASLIITEYPKDKGELYSKCVTIKFDGKNQYIIRSHRADEIKALSKDNRINIEKLQY